MRPIDADALLEEIEEEIEAEKSYDNYDKGVTAGLRIALRDVKKQPTIEAEPDKGWISVKDRLPDGNGKYIVWADGELNICEYDVESQTFGDTFYDYDEMYSKLLCWDDYINKFVTHWLPSPEPPKGE